MILLLGLLIAAAAPAPKPAMPAPSVNKALTGNWAGDGFALRATTTGYVVQGKCASGKITSQIVTDAAGSFRAGGYFNPYSTGYRLSDVGRRDVPAVFSGRLSGNSLALTLAVAGRDEAHFVLKQGARIRFPKCA